MQDPEVPGGAFHRQQQRQGPVPLWTRFVQGIGALPGSHKDFAFNTLLLLYYSQILGVPASAAAVVLAVALVADAISDPLVGAWSDNLRTRLGRRHPLMYASALPLGLGMYLLFSPPVAASNMLLLAWMLACTLLVRLAFTFFYVPWAALAAELSEDYAERTAIVTWRYLVGWVGGVVFAFCIYSFVFASSAEYPAGQLDPGNYSTFAVVLAVLVTFWSLLTTHLTRDQVPYLLQPSAPTPRFNLGALVRLVMLAMRSSNFRLLFLAVLMFAGIAGVAGVYDIYMNTYFWEFTPEDLRWYGFTIIGALSSFVLVPMLQRRFQKQQILAAALTAAIVLATSKVGFRFLDIWPANGDPLLLPLLVAHASFSVLVLTTAGILFASIVADLVDEQELNTGLRQEGVFASALGFSAKATSSLGLIIGGVLLDLVIVFPRGTAPGGVAEEVLVRLAVLDGFVLPLFNLVPVWLLGRYTLTRDRVTEVQAALRRGREGPGI